VWEFECTLARVLTRTGRFTVMAERKEDAEEQALKILADPKNPAVQWDAEAACQSSMVVSIEKVEKA
jgi:hypothetical protein